ncbi:hypothetical protein DRN52_07170 [Thermococci archaeon]|nr:MAG: hypothetical protein DRN52_07170 [Thermococci archaeon]
MFKIRPKPEEVPLSKIIEWATNGELGIPEFQRKFAWTRQDIEELLVSILKGYFIGSFLFLKIISGQAPFASRPLQGTERLPKVNADFNPRILVLDGQQRITSLIYALYAPKADLITPKYTSKQYFFFLKLKELEDGNADNAVFSCSEDDKRTKKYLSNEESQYREKIIPFIILRSKDEWNNWVNKFKNYQRKKILEELKERRSSEIIEEINRRLNGLDEQVKKWNEYINNLFEYPTSVVYLPEIRADDRESLEQITLIFEKINTTGVKLSVFDLLNARLYLKGIRLHNLWEESVQNYETLKELSNDNSDLAKILVLRTIGLLRLLRVNFNTEKSEISDIKNRSLINLTSNKFEDDWHIAIEYIDKALKRIMSTSDDGFGAFMIKWIPYKAMIPVFAVFLYYIENELEFLRRVYAIEILKKWYWASVFSERYSGSPENTSLEDLKELINSIKDMKMPEIINKAIIYIKGLNLRKVYSSSSAVYRGVMDLIILNGAKDFLYGDDIAFYELEDHHIFPRRYLEKELKLGEKALINTILNRTLISKRTNDHIKSRAPSEYLREIEHIGDPSSILEPHFIPTPCIEHMRNNNYDEFLNCREQAIKSKLLQLLK